MSLRVSTATFNNACSPRLALATAAALRARHRRRRRRRRQGALGWLGGAAVQRNTSDGSSGNFGLQDSRAALRWVQRNIGAFGGDASRVTIFGESSGASMVEAHVVAPRSNGLFVRALLGWPLFHRLG